MKYLQIQWMNYQGDIEIRRVIPKSHDAVELNSSPGVPDYPTPHFLFHTHDLDKNAPRTYELTRILSLEEKEG